MTARDEGRPVTPHRHKCQECGIGLTDPGFVESLIDARAAAEARVAALEAGLRALRLNIHHAEYCAPGDLDEHCICGITAAVVAADALLTPESPNA